MWRCNEKISGGVGVTNAISVKERLKKQAIEDGKTMQDKLVTYGLERTIYRLSVSKYAEKFEALVSLGLANSRYKDFYDIYVLADSYNLDGMELMKAIVETFTHRETNFDDIAAFDDNFTKDETRQRRWRAFTKKKKALVKVEFEETMQLLKELLLPIVDSIHNNNSFEQTWSKEAKRWI